MTLPRPPAGNGLVIRTDANIILGAVVLTADATLADTYIDELSVTQNAVEENANITHHVRREPSAYSCTAHFTDTPLQRAGLTHNIDEPGRNIPREGRSQEAYERLLVIAQLRLPVQLLTPRRTYSNMLLRSIRLAEQPPAEDAVEVDLEFVELIRVSSRRVFLPEEVAEVVPPTVESGQAQADAASRLEAARAVTKSGPSTALQRVMGNDLTQQHLTGQITVGAAAAQRVEQLGESLGFSPDLLAP